MNSAPTTLKLSAVLGVALLFVGLSLQSTSAEEVVVSEKNTAPNTAAATSESPAGVTEAAVATPAVPDRKLSEPLQELIKMAERGLGDEVLIAWIKNSPAAFSVAPDDIVYLTDLGISEPVVKALIEHQGNPAATKPVEPAPAPINPPVGQPSPNLPASAPNAPPAVAIAAAPEFETAPQAPQAPSQVTYVQQPVPVQENYFYSSLASYGSWIEVPDYGLCWRPTVAVIDTGWRPYCHRGRWLYTNCGWYWQSDYSWGWAPFHYGRWWNHPRCGWVWTPDTVWSPAWVTWRYSDSYCGWAPLPPGCGYRSGVGLTFHSAGVSISFDFGLGLNCYTFVPTGRFHDRTPWRHALPAHQVVNVYNHTAIINNISHNSNNTLVNEGPAHDRIAKITRSEIQKVNIRDVPTEGPRVVKSDRIERGGKELSVYRPLNPTLPPEGSGGTVSRHEITKTPVAMSPRASESASPSVRTIGSTRTGNAPTSSSVSRLTASTATSAGASGRTETLTEASLSKSALGDHAPQGATSRRTMNSSVPVVRAPSTPASKSSFENRPAISTPSATIRSVPSESASPRNVAPQPIIPPLITQRPPSVSRSPINSSAPAATPNSQATYDARSARAVPAPGTPTYRQEVTKPIIVSSPQSQTYSTPTPITRIAPQNSQSYSPGPTIQSVPHSSSGPVSIPQASRASPVYSAPRQQSAPAPSAPRAVTSQPSSGGEKSSDRRTDRSNTR